MNKIKIAFIIFGVLCLVLKIYFISICNPHLQFNDDDQRNYTIANNYVQGKGYGLYDNMVHRYRLSAFHASSTVFLYQFLIEHRVPQKNTVIVFYIFSIVLYFLAVYYLYRILMVLNVPLVVACIGTAIFALYPSVMYGVGSIYHFDNIVMPLHVINFYYVLQWIKGKPASAGRMIFLVVSITLCCFLRSQVLLLYFLTGCFLLFLYIKSLLKTKRADYHIPVFLTSLALCVILSFVPALIKNKSMFNAYIVSTQKGFEFLQGHNEVQRGNWFIQYPGGALDVYVHSQVPNIDAMDEYTESKARDSLAWNWIKRNPGKEAMYMLKKTGRFFVPENANLGSIEPVFRYHPLTIVVHLFFIVSGLILLFKKRRILFSKEVLLLFIPVAAMILLSVIFFFDLRLRYHAEPFIIVLAAYFVTRLLASKKQQRAGAFSKTELSV